MAAPKKPGLSLRGELCRSNLMVGPKGEIAAIKGLRQSEIASPPERPPAVRNDNDGFLPVRRAPARRSCSQQSHGWPEVGDCGNQEIAAIRDCFTAGKTTGGSQ
jgi:hypothetical protein